LQSRRFTKSLEKSAKRCIIKRRPWSSGYEGSGIGGGERGVGQAGEGDPKVKITEVWRLRNLVKVVGRKNSPWGKLAGWEEKGNLWGAYPPASESG